MRRPSGRISRGIARTLKECGTSREEIARRMSMWLGEGVSKHARRGARP